MKNKKGSSIVLLAMVFVTMAACISASIGIARALVVKSECQTFGKVWAKAILSEYDVHLLNDYGLMAYYGNDIEVQKRIDSYLLYSCDSKLDAIIGDSEAFLAGYELSNPDNFSNAIKKMNYIKTADSILNSNCRTERDNPLDNIGSRKIANEVVIDTLPSKGIDNTLDIDTLVNNVKDGKSIETLLNNAKETTIDISYMNNYLNSLTSYCGKNETYFKNEWEYVIVGKLDDEANYKACRRRLFLLRNALNLAALYEDTTKIETIAAVAEIITPGAGALTQAIIAEAWAAAETEEDLKALYNGERIPILKTAAEWKTDFNVALDTEDIKKELNEEKTKQIKEIIDTTKGEDINEIRKGLDYEEYLMIFLVFMNENTRILRIMDIVQINMKFRYYDDFNMSEYFIGVNFYINANGKQYEIKDIYQ